MDRSSPRTPTGAFSTAVTTVMSLLLAGLAAGAFAVAGVATRDQLTTLGLQGALLLANELRARRPPERGMLRRVIESFEADGIAGVALVGPGRRVAASSRPDPTPDLASDPVLDAAFRTGEVQAGWTPAGDRETFRVHVPVDRIPGPRWRPHPHGRPTPPLPPPPDPGDDAPWPPPEWGFEPGRAVLVLDVEPDRASWLWRWASVQAAVSAGAVVLLWIAWFGARRAARAIASLEADRRRREALARIGEMSAVLAHEVRNPLASLKGQLQLAVEEMGRAPPGEAAVPGRVSRALEEAGRIEALIRGLLDYARDARPRVVPVPAEALLSLARDLAGPWPGGVELRMDAPPGLVLRADRDEMARAVANLLRNAAEAAGPGGRVRVTVASDPAGYRVTVEDSGPGVPDDLRERLFEPFVTGRVRGVGLGLAVARKVVEAHHGRIEAGRSEDLGGARFDVTWPATGGGGRGAGGEASP